MITIDGFRVVAEKKLIEQFGGVTIDYMSTGWSEGFSIRPINQEGKECGSCSC